MDFELFDKITALAGFLDSLSALFVILALLLIALLYFTFSYTLMLIGRKAGKAEDWMAYVPIAKDIYRLSFVGAPTWHVFFFGFTGTLLIVTAEFVMYKLFVASLSSAFLVMGTVLLLAYAAASVYVTFRFLSRYYSCFGFHPMLAMVHFTPILCFFEPAFELYFAYSREVDFHKGAQEKGCSAAALEQGYIFGLSGKYQGATFEIGDMEEISFGREHPDCQIVFDQFDTDVSRLHCSVRFSGRDNKYIVSDHSMNGTLLGDGKRLQPGVPAALPAGSVILLGSRQNMFRLG